MLTLDKTPSLTLKKPALPEAIKPQLVVPHVTLSQVFHALRKQTIKARPTVCASFWRYRKSGRCYINANGITKRVGSNIFYSVQQNADKRYSFWNDAEKSGSSATVRKCFLVGFGVGHD